MEFRIRHKREFIVSLIGIMVAFYLLDFYYFEVHTVAKFTSGILILFFLFCRYIYFRDYGYIIENGKIIMRNSRNTYFKISKIKCISQEWTSAAFMNPRIHTVKYYIIFNGSNNKLLINLNFRNNKGQSLLTVLENNFDIRVNKVV